MAYYAELDKENKVVSIKTASDEDSFHGEYVFTVSTGKRHVRTSYNTKGGTHYDPATGEPSADQSKALRKNSAGIGFTYDQELDAFIPPNPFESWILNQETCLWHAPVKMPEEEGKSFIWNEETTSWKELIPTA